MRDIPQTAAGAPPTPTPSRPVRLARTSVWLGGFGVGLAIAVAVGALLLTVMFADGVRLPAAVAAFGGLVVLPLIALGIAIGAPISVLLCASALVVAGMARAADRRERAAGAPSVLASRFRVMVVLDGLAIAVCVVVMVWGGIRLSGVLV